MSHAPRPILAVSLGDPGGIGPEVIVKALADPHRRARADLLVVGASRPLVLAAQAAGLGTDWLVPTAQPAPEPGRVAVWDPLNTPATHAFPSNTDADNGERSFRWCEHAIALASRRQCHGIVTAPISKEAWAQAGHTAYPGHTELLAERFHAPHARMFFHCPPASTVPAFNVVLVTTHVALAAVPKLLDVPRVQGSIELGAAACRALGVPAPRLAVCGLNPHAGEHGLMGDEETRVIQPAIDAARRLGINVQGPFPGDTIFNAATRGAFDLVVAMYHDQGLIPVKLLAWDRAVNVTLGLPTVRTSPDHGTAFDIAGTNRANAGSMASAIDLAARLALAHPR